MRVVAQEEAFHEGSAKKIPERKKTGLYLVKNEPQVDRSDLFRMVETWLMSPSLETMKEGMKIEEQLKDYLQTNPNDQTVKQYLKRLETTRRKIGRDAWNELDAKNQVRREKALEEPPPIPKDNRPWAIRTAEQIDAKEAIEDARRKVRKAVTPKKPATIEPPAETKTVDTKPPTIPDTTMEEDWLKNKTKDGDGDGGDDTPKQKSPWWKRMGVALGLVGAAGGAAYLASEREPEPDKTTPHNLQLKAEQIPQPPAGDKPFFVPGEEKISLPAITPEINPDTTSDNKFDYFGIEDSESRELINTFIETLGKNFGLSKDQAITAIDMARIRTNKANDLHKIINNPVAAGTEFYNYVMKKIKENQKTTGDNQYWKNFTELSHNFGISDPDSPNADSRLATMAARVHHLTITDEAGNEKTNFHLHGKSKGPLIVIPPIAIGEGKKDKDEKVKAKGRFTGIQDYTKDPQELFTKGHNSPKNTDKAQPVINQFYPKSEAETVSPTPTVAMESPIANPDQVGTVDYLQAGKAEVARVHVEHQNKLIVFLKDEITKAEESIRNEEERLASDPEIKGLEKVAGDIRNELDKMFNAYKKAHKGDNPRPTKWDDVQDTAFQAKIKDWENAKQQVKHGYGKLFFYEGNLRALKQQLEKAKKEKNKTGNGEEI